MFSRTIALILALSLAMVAFPVGAQTIAPGGADGPGQPGQRSLRNNLALAPTGGSDNVIERKSGYNHTLMLKRDGTVWASGSNSDHQLGDDTVRNSSTPIQVKGPNGDGYLTDVIQIAAGARFSMALKRDGTVWAWGALDVDLTGHGDFISSTPAQVPGPGWNGYLTDITVIASGAYHSLALKNDGTVWSWGQNADGQLGTGTSRDSYVPVQVVGPNGIGHLTDVSWVSATAYSSRAQKSDATIWDWGQKEGSRPQSNVPIYVGTGQLWNRELDLLAQQYLGDSAGPVPETFQVVDDRYTTPANQTLDVSAPGVLANDISVDASAQLVTSPTHGSLTLNPDGSFVYTPARGFSGTDHFTYQARSGSSTAIGSVTIRVIGPGTNCAGCDLPGAALSGGNLFGVNLSRANLSLADLGGANLQGANLAGSDLSSAYLVGAKLNGANLSKADLAVADLSHASLRGANLAKANLPWANLTGANLQGANLSGVTWDNTTCPDGTKSDQNGGTCLNHLNP